MRHTPPIAPTPPQPAPLSHKPDHWATLQTGLTRSLKKDGTQYKRPPEHLSEKVYLYENPLKESEVQTPNSYLTSPQLHALTSSLACTLPLTAVPLLPTPRLQALFQPEVAAQAKKRAELLASNRKNIPPAPTTVTVQITLNKQEQTLLHFLLLITQQNPTPTEKHLNPEHSTLLSIQWLSPLLKALKFRDGHTLNCALHTLQLLGLVHSHNPLGIIRRTPPKPNSTPQLILSLHAKPCHRLLFPLPTPHSHTELPADSAAASSISPLDTATIPPIDPWTLFNSLPAPTPPWWCPLRGRPPSRHIHTSETPSNATPSHTPTPPPSSPLSTHTPSNTPSVPACSSELTPLLPLPPQSAEPSTPLNYSTILTLYHLHTTQSYAAHAQSAHDATPVPPSHPAHPDNQAWNLLHLAHIRHYPNWSSFLSSTPFIALSPLQLPPTATTPQQQPPTPPHSPPLAHPTLPPEIPLPTIALAPNSSWHVYTSGPKTFPVPTLPIELTLFPRVIHSKRTPEITLRTLTTYITLSALTGTYGKTGPAPRQLLSNLSNLSLGSLHLSLLVLAGLKLALTIRQPVVKVKCPYSNNTLYITSPAEYQLAAHNPDLLLHINPQTPFIPLDDSGKRPSHYQYELDLTPRHPSKNPLPEVPNYLTLQPPSPYDPSVPDYDPYTPPHERHTDDIDLDSILNTTPFDPDLILLHTPMPPEPTYPLPPTSATPSPTPKTKPKKQPPNTTSSSTPPPKKPRKKRTPKPKNPPTLIPIPLHPYTHPIIPLPRPSPNMPTPGILQPVPPHLLPKLCQAYNRALKRHLHSLNQS